MINKSSAAGLHKQKANVTLTLAGQKPMDAAVFLTLNQRLIDLLNDDRCFIPAEKADGETIIIAKTQIVSIIEKDTMNGQNARDHDTESNKAANGTDRKTFDPYAALRIMPDASLDEVRAAYKTRIKAVHPDSLSGLDLDEDLARAALQATQRVNFAYKKILAERKDIRRGSSHDTENAA